MNAPAVPPYPSVAPWAVLAEVLLMDRLRPSDGVRAALRALSPITDRIRDRVAPEGWAERLQAILKDANKAVAPPHRPWVALAAAAAGLREGGPAERSAAAALDAVLEEYHLEIRGAARVRITHHAVQRYVQRFRKDLDADRGPDYREAAAELLRSAARVHHAGRRNGARDLVAKDNPRLRFVVARDGTAVTVLRGEE